MIMVAHSPPRWCAHPRMARGEAFSSWLHRAALANGLTNHCFARGVFGEQQIWTRDTDRVADAAVCQIAANALGESLFRVRSGTLHAYAGRVFPTLKTNGWLPWITPVGVFHRTRRHHGWAFCPLCLSEGRTAIIGWRLAFSVTCLRHMCSLLDACPDCGSAFEFHRMELCESGRRPCSRCGCNLASSRHVAPIRRYALALQHRMNKVMRQGWAVMGSQKVNAVDWFAGLRVVLVGLYPSAASPGLTDSWSRVARARILISPRNTPFEHWAMVDRASAMAALEPYIRDWPDRLVRDAIRANVYRSRFGDEREHPWPRWLNTAFDTLRRDE